MALEFPSNFLDLNSVYELATSQGVDAWIGMGVHIILSTIIGGILLIIIMYLFSSKFGENVHLANSFVVVLLASIINTFGIIGFLTPFVSVLPYGFLLLSFLVWIALLKLFFRDMGMLHIVLVAIVFILVMTFVTPQITSYSMQFLPSFG